MLKHSIRSHVVLIGLAIQTVVVQAQEPPPPCKVLELGSIGGWVATPDNVTLIASLPDAGQLEFFDTVAGEKTTTIEVDFAPNRLALQGDTLFASVRGSSLVYALNAKTGEELNRFKVPGEPIEDLACHPRSGPLFAANLNEDIMLIEPARAHVAVTEAHGKFLAVDPVNGRFLLAALNRPSEDFIEIERGPRGGRVRLVTVAERAPVLKYEIRRSQLKLVAANMNTAIGAGGSLAISPDGKRFAMVAGGGWRSLTDQRFHYVIAVFETGDMETMVGQIELGAYPHTMAYHPVLDLGVAFRRGNNAELRLFSARSLTDRGVLTCPGAPRGSPTDQHRVMFVGRGTTLAHHFGRTLAWIPLDLSDDERELLKKRYGSNEAVGAESRSDDPSSDSRKEGFRTWNDNTGTFRVVAKLVEVGDDHVKLEMENGQQLTVPFARLSSTDLQFANEQAQRRDREKVKRGRFDL